MSKEFNPDLDTVLAEVNSAFTSISASTDSIVENGKAIVDTMRSTRAEPELVEIKSS